MLRRWMLYDANHLWPDNGIAYHAPADMTPQEVAAAHDRVMASVDSWNAWIKDFNYETAPSTTFKRWWRNFWRGVWRLPV